MLAAGPGIGESRVRSRWRVWLGGRDKAMAPLRVHRNALDQADLSPRGHRLPQRPARYPLAGRYFVAGLAFSRRWWEFSIIPFLGLPTGMPTAGANALVWPPSSKSKKIFGKIFSAPSTPRGGKSKSL